MKNHVILVGVPEPQKSALMIESLKEKFGQDIIVVTPEEAKEKGLSMEDFGNVPTMKIEDTRIFDEPRHIQFKSGRQTRRERRMSERKLNKKDKKRKF